MPDQETEDKLETPVEQKSEQVVEEKSEIKAAAQPEQKTEVKSEVKTESDWRDKRIAELTRKVNEARRAAQSPPAAQQAPGESAEAFEARVAAEATRLASQIASQESWNKTCNDVVAAGKKEFGDEAFSKAVTAINSVVNGQDQTEVQQFNEFLNAVIDTGEATKLISSLGENPGEVTRFMQMSQTKRAVELTKMAMKLASPKGEEEPSGAPKPITPVGSMGKHYDGLKPDDKDNGASLPIGEWMKRREKQVMDQRKAGVMMQ